MSPTELYALIGAIAAVTTVAAFFVAQRGRTRDAGRDNQYVRDKLDIISENVKETRTDIREIKHTIADHEGRINRLEVRMDHVDGRGE